MRDTIKDNLVLITPIVLTYNEEDNLQRTLHCLRSFHEVVVLDSGSSDGTKAICDSFPNVVFFTRPFDNFAGQWIFAHTLTTNRWILSLDADYQVTPALLQEIMQLDLQHNAYKVRFKYFVYGKPIRGAIIPPRIVLYDKEKSAYTQDGHAQCLTVEQPTVLLTHPILHDDRKPLNRWLQSQQRYAREELAKLTAPGVIVTGADKVRMKTFLAPVLVFWFTLLVKGAIFSGRRGLFYALQRMYAELLFLLTRLDHAQAEEEKSITRKQ